jgi:hypothetical protein
MVDHAPSPRRLRALAASLEELDLGGVDEETEARRRRAVVACRDYLVPRLEDPTGPLVVVVAGPSGGGTSTIVNALAQRRVTDVGPVRPTTTRPVVWAGSDVPAIAAVIESKAPDTTVDSSGRGLDGGVIVDAPSPGVTGGDGRPVVHELLAVADAMVFVAGASRYADAEAFGLLAAAARRGLPTVMVLNRLPRAPELQQRVATDFAEKLATRRLVPRPDPDLIVMVAESSTADGIASLVPEEVARVRKELEAMIDPQSRPEIVTFVVGRTLELLRSDLAAIRAGLIDHEVRRVELLDPMRAFFRGEGRRLIADVRGGVFAGVDDPLDSVASAAARRAGTAARATAEAWSEIAPGLVDAHPDLFRHADETVEAAREHLEFWVGELDSLIQRRTRRGMSRRKRRRVARHMRAAVFDPAVVPGRAVRRALGSVPGIVEAARELLAEELQGIVDADSRRFEDVVGPRTPEGLLALLADVVNDE